LALIDGLYLDLRCEVARRGRDGNFGTGGCFYWRYPPAEIARFDDVTGETAIWLRHRQRDRRRLGPSGERA
jgi:hypothetical protein